LGCFGTRMDTYKPPENASTMGVHPYTFAGGSVEPAQIPS